MANEQYQFLSTLEKKVHNWLIKHEIPFRTQLKMFGISELGSQTVDFVIDDRNLVLRVMGAYYHSSFESRARDELGKERLVNEGYIVVDLHEDDLGDDDLDRTLELALQGVEIPR